MMQSRLIRRRDFLRAAGAGAISLAWTGHALAQERSSSGESPTRPNIIFILADDLGYGDVSCLNPDSRITTPNMDRLAAEGLRFTDAHSGSAVCTPTRYGVVTGRYCWRSALKKGVLWGYSPMLIEPGRMTVASLLKEHGYATSCFGKWHLGLGNEAKTDYGKPLRPGPVDVGFDEFFGIPASLDMEPYLYVENDHPVEAPTEHIERSAHPRFWRAGPIAPGFRHVDVLPELTKRATRWMEDHAKTQPQRPFFMYFPLTAPHTPVLPVPMAKDKSRAGEYGDFVWQVDWTIGQVMETLQRLGIDENTLIMVTSDNGPENITQALVPDYGHYSNYHFRGRKRDAWEGGHRVPFFARWPGRIKPGSVCEQTICLTDLMATCAEIVGASLPSDAAEDSYSILPALLGKTLDRPIREATVHHSANGEFAIRQGCWKLILCRGSGGNRYTTGPNAIQNDDPPGQLYDLSADVVERRNLYRERPEIVRRLTALMDRYKQQGRSRPV